MSPDPATTLPLFPLPNVVHFPSTQLRLHVFEPRYRQLVDDLLAAEPQERWLGIVTMRPDRRPRDPHPDIFPAGTAALLVGHEGLPDGRSNIVLAGRFRFEVRRELTPRPYRRAEVERLSEPPYREDDPGIVAMRRELVAQVRALATVFGERFPVDPEELDGETTALRFGELVNRIAADIDLPASRKLKLLAEPLPLRATQLLEAMKGRWTVLELLRPFAHLAKDPQSN